MLTGQVTSQTKVGHNLASSYPGGGLVLSEVGVLSREKFTNSKVGLGLVKRPRRILLGRARGLQACQCPQTTPSALQSMLLPLF